MSTQQAQIVDPQEFIDILDYEFTGDTSTVEKKRLFIQGLREKSTVYHAAQFAGIHRATAYNWMEADPAFATACDDSREDAGDIMETSAYEDALGRDGKRGDPILKMFWLKAHRPKFRDRMTVDVEVIRNEIQERIRTLQLAPANLVDVVPQFQQSVLSEQQNPPQSAQKQKEHVQAHSALPTPDLD